MIRRWLRRRAGPERRRIAAVREAGHALVAHLHGLRVTEIRLQPEPDGHPLLDGLRYAADSAALRHAPEGHFVALLKKAEVALAGQVAARLLLGVDSHGAAEEIAADLAGRLAPSRRQRDALLELARARVADLLAEARYRDALRALAERLETEEVLGRDALHLVLLSGITLPD
jgi:hypothetical protein